MKRFLLPAIAMTLAPGLTAQANVVPGLDGRLTVISDLTYWGRRGPAHPNGEVGMSMLNTMCNPGSVNIPWFAPMQPNHPFFGFLIVRVSNGRMEQISDWSYCKHAFLSVNVNGACGTCIDPGTGSLMGLNCSDTYSAGNNASRTYLGPPSEIDPWLGTWDPVGSYFDIGDPTQPGGLVLPPDGIRSLNPNNFDAVKNRITVRESDLLVPGASYFYAIQLIHRGEALANRGDNNASRGFTPSWSGSSWSFANNSNGQTYGSVLTRWPGADVDSGHNGNHDGRFFVGVVVTPLGGGSYHYEYAVHNVDNSRAGAALRIPIDAAATASNFSFRDIDQNPLNNWTGARVGNEIVFTAPAGNPLEWNTIYNFGFDADFPPGQGICSIAAARPGPGALFVDVPTKVPSGSTFATATAFGTGCGGTAGCPGAIYDTPGFTLANSSFSLLLSSGNYTLVPGAGSWIGGGTNLGLGDDSEVVQSLGFSLPYPGGSTSTLRICSNGWMSVGTHSGGNNYTPTVSSFLNSSARWAPMWHDLNPAAGGTVTFQTDGTRAVVTFTNVPNFGVGGTATFQIQFWATGAVHVIYQNVSVGGNEYLVGFSRGNGVADPGNTNIAASLNLGLGVCNPVVPSTPNLALAASNRPILGTTINLNTTGIPAGSLLGLSILSLTELQPPVPLDFLGMNGCTLYVGLDLLSQFATPGATASVPLVLPVNPALSGALLLTQSATLSLGINAFNFVSSNAVRLLLGLN